MNNNKYSGPAVFTTSQVILAIDDLLAGDLDGITLNSEEKDSIGALGDKMRAAIRIANQKTKKRHAHEEQPPFERFLPPDEPEEEMREELATLLTIHVGEGECILPKKVLSALLRTGLNDKQRYATIVACYGTGDLLERELRTVEEVYDTLLVLFNNGEDNQAPNAEMSFNGRWYPVRFSVRAHQGWTGMFCLISAHVAFGDDAIEQVNKVISNRAFEPAADSTNTRRVKTITKILEGIELRLPQTSLAEYADKLSRTEEMQEKSGAVVAVTNSVMMHHKFGWWTSIEATHYGTEQHPKRVIIEGKLEVDKDNGGRRSFTEDQIQRLPFVRVFALDQKKYLYVDVEDFAQAQFDKHAISRLVVSKEMRSILNRVFDTKSEDLFGDLIAGKGGGMVILAHGKPGIGKTMTAEAFAEATSRPLYIMEVGELGTDLNHIEDNLNRIFIRAGRWNAILLFDEADIFLHRRGEDLERNAIVGVFLRMLDYYHGLLFLTTNLVDKIDQAFKSRITLSLAYPDLTPEIRIKIWKLMLDSAGIQFNGNITLVGELDLNGRQIRNLVRLIRVMYPGRTVTAEEVVEVSQYACK